MPYFLDRDPSLKGDLLDVFLKVNRDLRKANGERVKALCSNSESRPLWDGPFLRLPNSKTMAGFADHRVYTYQGKEIDRQVHLGVDLASVAMSPVMAANRGKVIFAGELGIYGNTVLLDHGCGLFSMYSHLSRIDVQSGTMLQKGDILGRTGSTGLAGGDHLHFSMLVRGFFVHPKEWWDPRWVEDHVTARLDLLRTGS
jgi:murein DD-endopeptidase MepM/ murein hydrolase activator NlpD